MSPQILLNFTTSHKNNSFTKPALLLAHYCFLSHNLDTLNQAGWQFTKANLIMFTVACLVYLSPILPATCNHTQC